MDLHLQYNEVNVSVNNSIHTLQPTCLSTVKYKYTITEHCTIKFGMGNVNTEHTQSNLNNSIIKLAIPFLFLKNTCHPLKSYNSFYIPKTNNYATIKNRFPTFWSSIDTGSLSLLLHSFSNTM